MKIWLSCLGLTFIMLSSSACGSGIHNKTATPKIQVSNSPQPQTPINITTTTNTPIPQAQPAATRLPQPTQTPNPEVEWTDALSMVVLNGLSGVWSPTEHAFLYNAHGPESNELFKVAGPAFQPTALIPGRYFEDYSWSPDGQKILYIGIVDPQPSPSVIFIMDANGNNIHNLNSQISGPQYLWLKGWMDQNNLMFANYSGGGHQIIEIVNIKTGKLASWGAFIHGAVFPSQNGYIPATTTVNPDVHQALVISEKFPKINFDEDIFIGGNIRALPLYKSIPRRNTTSVFHDWRPYSNQMLVSWGRIDRAWNILDPALLLWDVEKNTLQLIAPDGKSGKFSPDGKLLAYLTDGPDLDGNHLSAIEDQAALKTPVNYMRLLDIQNNKLLMTIPVLSDIDMDLLGVQGYVTMQAQFSPNGRYLGFLSPGKLKVYSDGWPSSVDSIDTTYTTINLLDIQEKKLIWSAASNDEAKFSWSPDNNLLIYQDETMNWQLLDIDDFQTTPITITNGEHVDTPGWAYNGEYLSLISCLPLSKNTCQRSIHIFDVMHKK